MSGVTGLPDSAEGALGPVLVLIGPPGAGKSTVGQVLATRLGVPVHDSDRMIERAQGREISDIFVDDGEAFFRELERAEVLRALEEETGVLALGGGAVMQEQIAQALRASGRPVVFLDVSIADASRRIGFDASRPLLLVNPRASWTRMMNTRRPTYEELSTVQVSTGGKDPEQVADEVLSALGLAGSA
ncbi:shikimate kinase [Ornithinimicrobium pratense]|uniref:Shikimate kinase n=1 Tax=Ornithinimicrobium pratense TaxID=2593973 RepID=A0A5J6V8R9_9MICO|nr:shikimate kinase [Ornithinimicrobium pratense]QFG70249.1 shikimate kinase [Ornithinimicrobium pratense]